MALVIGLTKLIEKELQGIHNPIACVDEEIYSGSLISNSITEIIIPRIGDLIQDLDIKYSCHSHPLTIEKAYIETVCDYEQHGKLWKNQWPLHIFKTNTGFKLICDYEVNLLRPYQVTKLVLVTNNSELNGSKHSVSIMANYIFVDIESRRKLIL